MLTSHDSYEINVVYPIANIHHRSVQLLYQPLIGYEATSVYFYLWAEADQIALTKSPCYHQRISKILGMPLTQIDVSIKKLEAIGLLNTYQKKSDESKYIYELLLPLAPDAFFKHQILNVLLQQTLGKEEYQRTQYCFKRYCVDTSNYQNITASFQDVFSISMDGTTKKPLVDGKYIEEQSNAIERHYPLELFYAGLAAYQIKRDSITKEQERIIQQVGTMYQIDALTMQGLVKQAMVNDRLDTDVLLRECRAYYQLQEPKKFTNVYHKQSVKHKSVKTNTSIDQHIAYLERMTPHELLRAKQGGKEPTRKDIVIVESIMTTLGLEPGVMNVLIEMTLKECDNTLPRGYMEHYAGQWKRKKIHTVFAAMQEARQNMKQKDKNRIVIPAVNDTVEVTLEKSGIDDETLSKLLAKYD